MMTEDEDKEIDLSSHVSLVIPLQSKLKNKIIIPRIKLAGSLTKQSEEIRLLFP